MSAQNQELAEQLCALSTGRGGSLSAEQVEHLRGYLTACLVNGEARRYLRLLLLKHLAPHRSESASATPSRRAVEE